MIIGVIVLVLIIIKDLKATGSFTKLIAKYNEDVSNVILTVIMLGIVSAFVALMIGILISDVETLYDNYLYTSNEITSYKETNDEFNIGINKYRNSSEYIYKLNTDKGRIDQTIYTDRVYIKDSTDDKGRIEKHKQKFKNDKLKLIAFNMTNGYNVLVLPKGYTVIQNEGN